MDIDEFLDRELSDLGLSSESSEKTESLDTKSAQASSLFDAVKANLSKGNLDMAEQAYVQLWHILMRQKLKWNSGLYEQLYALSRQFSSALNRAYNEVKKKANSIYELINRAKAFLKEGKKELPFRLYSEAEEISNSIPNVFFEEKKLIQEQLMGLYKELRYITDNDLLRRVSSLLQEINQLTEKISIAIRSNDMVNAIVSYNKCIELYVQVPEGFLRHKNSLGIRLLDIYKTLSIWNEISSLQKQLQQQATPQPQQISPNAPQASHATKSMLLHTRKESAKRNIEKGFYNEASKDIEEALHIEPNDAEAKAMRAKIKTLQ